MRVFRTTLFLMALALALPNVAFAQFGGAPQPGQIGSYARPKTNNYPAFSPYLNMTRPGNPATNYYGIVRPQMEANQNFQQIEQGTFGNDPRFNASAGADGSAMPGMNRYYPDQARGLQTGHPTTYFYYSHYYQFPNIKGGGGGAGSSGVAGTNSAFGRPTTQALPFFTGSNGFIMPVNPAGANPIGGVFGTNQPQVPGQVITP